LLHYVRMVGERRRVKQRLNALFLESAVRVPRPERAAGRLPIRRLPTGAARQVARAYVRQLEVVDELVAISKKLLLDAASCDPTSRCRLPSGAVNFARSSSIMWLAASERQSQGLHSHVRLRR